MTEDQEIQDQELIPDAFAQLGLSAALVETINELGYESPTPIQERAIPLMLAGRDLIGQAQTGTGKTAAFALPMLDKIDAGRSVVQALILTPTRELAIQVSEAIHTYAHHLRRIRVMPVYGGDSMGKQVSRLRGGIHVVVGTPGRVMDHLRRGTLDFSGLKMVVLDEADEMLRMGFLDDVEWILGQAPAERQTVLFSATMPREVRRITDRYLTKPAVVEIRHATVTVPAVEQHYFHVPENRKLNVLTQVLEAEATPGEAILIFVRTKIGAADLAEKLQARGYEAEAMHGGMNQPQRESVIRRMRASQVEIVVATDVAARGLDVEQISLVINYDIPNDAESYVHRIGRTGRAGRAGKAMLFVAPREGHMMRAIENYTGQRLTPAKMPSPADVAAQRMTQLKQRILSALKAEDLETYLAMVDELIEESGRDVAEIAAAAARLVHGDAKRSEGRSAEPAQAGEPGMVRLFMDIGRSTGVYPSQIVAAIANEAGVPGSLIGAIDINDECSFVEIPSRYQQNALAGLSGVVICGRPTMVRLATPQDGAPQKRSSGRGAQGHRTFVDRKQGKGRNRIRA